MSIHPDLHQWDPHNPRALLTQRFDQPAFLAHAGGGYALALLAAADGGRELLLLESPGGQSWAISLAKESASPAQGERQLDHLPIIAAAALITAEEDSWGLDVPGDVELVAVHLERQIESLRRSAQAVLALVDVATDPPPVTRA